MKATLFCTDLKRGSHNMEHTSSNIKTITRKHTIKVVTSNTTNEITNTPKILSVQDEEMDKRASHAVKSAIERAIICKKPIAKYDAVSKKTYIEYANGEKKYVK